jgi:hypothetical protein
MTALWTFMGRKAAANPGAGLQTLCPVPYLVATCRGPAPVYADEPTMAAITHRRECWQMLLMTRRLRARCAATARAGGGAA